MSFDEDDWSDGDLEYYFDLEFDDAAPLRGTSQCDGRCDPICDWCLIAHDCPSACKGGICPYELQVIEDIHGPYYAAGVYDAIEKTKRARLSALSNQREYFAGYESHVRRNDPRRKRAELKRQAKCTSTYIIGF